MFQSVEIEGFGPGTRRRFAAAGAEQIEVHGSEAGCSRQQELQGKTLSSSEFHPQQAGTLVKSSFLVYIFSSPLCHVPNLRTSQELNFSLRLMRFSYDADRAIFFAGCLRFGFSWCMGAEGRLAARYAPGPAIQGSIRQQGSFGCQALLCPVHQ